MIHNADKVARLEASFERRACATLDYAQALERFCALWRHATLVAGPLGTDWRTDIAGDLALARVLNGRSPPA
jgi:hypothetical protein